MENRNGKIRSPLERRMKIIEMTLRSEAPLRTSDLAAYFGIKQNLLSYDLNYLETLGLVERGYGWVAARRRNEPFGGTDFASRQVREREKKQGIAIYIASRLRHAGDVVLDAGSTALAIAEQLVQKKATLDLTTNNLPLLLRVADAPGITCHVIGGDYSHQQGATVGTDAALAIEGKTFSAGVLAPRAITLVPSWLALAEGGPSGPTIRTALSRLATDRELQAEDAVSMNIYMNVYSADTAQKPIKSVLMKNAKQLFIAADHTKLFAVGEPFFTIIIPALANLESASVSLSSSSWAFVTPVRSREAVRSRRIASQAGGGEDIDVDAYVDVREPGYTVLVTSTDEDDRIPAELIRQLRILKGERHFEEIAPVLRSMIVVADRKGNPVPFEIP